MAARTAPWPATVQTDRLLLRPIEPADVPVVSRLMTDPEVRRYLGGPVAPDEVARRESACVGATTMFSVTRLSDDVVLGLIVIDPDTDPESHAAGDAEVSYQFLPEFWGHGYAREAVGAAVQFEAWQVQYTTRRADDGAAAAG